MAPRKSGCTIDADPPVALRDEPVRIQVSGLKAHQPVTLRARTTDEDGRPWESWATFVATDQGVVDVSRRPPLCGTYGKADAMGLFWSMMPVGARRPETKMFAWRTLDPLFVTLTAEAEGKPLASARLKRLAVLDEGRVVRRPVEEDGVVGTLFHPAAPGPHPAVVVLGGAGGRLGEGRAALLASHGFAALALAYLGIDPLPRMLVEIPLEYFRRAISWLQAQPWVRPDPVALLGNSKGGELALLLGATYPRKIRAVVAYVPSGVVWPGISPGWRGLRRRPRSSWTVRGDPVPFVDIPVHLSDVLGAVRSLVRGGAVSFKHLQERALEEEAAVAAGSIPVERIGGPILLISGTDDQVVPSTRLSEMVMARLEARNHPYPYEHLCYQGAGHMIGEPYLPSVTTRTGPLIAPLLQGGSMEANAFANADSWAKVLAFLKEHLVGDTR